MLNLIVKDILIQKKQFLISFAYILFLIVAFQQMGPAMFSAGVIAFTYMLVTASCVYEDKNKTDVMINSLPIRRNNIVAMKYLSVFIYFIMGTIAYVALTGIFTASGIPMKIYPLTLEGFLGGAIAVSLMTGLYFPIFFKLGYIQAFNVILFLGFFFGVYAFARILEKIDNNILIRNLIDFLNSQGDTAITLLISAVVLIFLALSFGLSVKFYNKREF